MNDPLPVEHMDKADDLYVLTEFFRERVKSVVLYAKQNGLREETDKARFFAHFVIRASRI